MVRLPKLGVQRARQEKEERRSKSVSVIVISILVCLSFLVVALIPVVEASPEGWSEDVRITYNTEAWDDEPVIAANGENVHLVWKNTESGFPQRIFYINSNDFGETWSDSKQLSLEPYSSKRVSMAVSGDNIHVVWDDTGGIAAYEIRYTRSTDGGNTWSEPMFISSDDGNNSLGPKIAVSEDGLNVHVVWVDERHDDGLLPPRTELYYNRSTDGGLTWEGEIRLTNAPHGSSGPNIAVFGSTVHVVWGDNRDGKFDIYYRHSLNSGATWQDEVALADGSNWEVGPDIGVWGDTVHVVWVEDISSDEDIILYRNSTDNSVTWGDPQVLTGPSVRAWRPKIAVLEDEVHVVWFDGRDGGREIYYKYSDSGGISWASDTRLTYTDESDSRLPEIAVDNDNIHVTWYDDRDGIREVYYKRSPDLVNVPEFSNVVIPTVVTITIYVSLIYKTRREEDKTNRRQRK